MIHWYRHISATLRLAVPVMISRVGILLMVVSDTAMSGIAGASSIAWYGIGAAPLIPMTLLSVGLLLGVQIMVAQADGAGHSQSAGSIWRVGMSIALILGIAQVLATRFAEPLLLLFGQSEAIVAGAAPVMSILGWGMPAMLVYTVCNLFLEAIHRPGPGMVIMLIAIGLNIALNAVLIPGVDAPGILQGISGAEGAALATTMVRCAMAVAAVVCVFALVDRQRYGFAPFSGDVRAISKRMLQIGAPMALGVGLESTAFTSMTLMAGVLGEVAVGAYTIAHNFNALIFMFGLGVSTAAAVRVGNALGRRDPQGVIHAGWIAVFVGTSLLLLAGLLLLFFRSEATQLYTDEIDVVTLTVAILPLVVLLLVPDGLQVILIGALRGANDFWSGAVAQFAGFWLVMVPVGWYFGLQQQGGVRMLLWAIAIGATVSTLIVAVRFYQLGNRLSRELPAARLS